jgi:hypothetical protein
MINAPVKKRPVVLRICIGVADAIGAARSVEKIHGKKR